MARNPPIPFLGNNVEQVLKTTTAFMIICIVSIFLSKWLDCNFFEVILLIILLYCVDIKTELRLRKK